MQALSQLSYTPTRKGAHYSHRDLSRNRAAVRNSPTPKPHVRVIATAAWRAENCPRLPVFLRTKSVEEPGMLDLIYQRGLAGGLMMRSLLGLCLACSALVAQAQTIEVDATECREGAQFIGNAAQ